MRNDSSVKKRIAILGSTGSIGTQALEVIEANPDVFEIEVLTAYNNAELLVKQAIKHVPNVVVIGNEEKYSFVKESLSNFPVKIYAGADAISQVVSMESIDLVLTAMVGYSGLTPTLAAIESGKNIALANKETMVVAGEMIRKLAIQKNVTIIPVDSEHSAIFQCLAGEEYNPVEKLILTASGGPFREKSLEFLKTVSKEQALSHPNWCMGAKITVDSASMMNKGLEVIEARWLFNVPQEKIEVVIHPQSIIHSMVQFEDGSVKAQMGLPDMRLPIVYALGFPVRIKSDFPRLNFRETLNMSFTPPDTKKFRNLAIAYEALRKGGNWPCIMNAANETAVNAFLCERIGFLEMSDIIEQVLEKSGFIQNPDLQQLQVSDKEARILANQLID
ncbi:MAG: 1-deoxy-D-xylulose-5-phosphate reductoisomerase [Bacteroidales bacterium]|nr:1-deoxy-D-xylulose-5-phosphate reductoisomerase [Bacteroidales bacterium]MCB8999216.1 1-deoxy-D-xylulose-5-phosphate reductoisomerase [Bacteroidales bacterium]